MGGLVGAPSATLAHQRAQHHGGKGDIEYCRSPVSSALEECLGFVSTFIAIKQSLHQAPASKGEQPAREAGEHEMAERLRQKGAQRVLGTNWALTSPHRCESGKGPDNQEHDAARCVADPCHPFKYGPPPHAVPLSISLRSISIRSLRWAFRLWLAGHTAIIAASPQHFRSRNVVSCGAFRSAPDADDRRASATQWNQSGRNLVSFLPQHRRTSCG